MSQLQLYTNPLCPFAHRVRLVLAEKGVHANQVEIDLRAKPAEFLALSPKGTVPVLKVRDEVLWESSVIAEYLEESYPEPPLLPRDPMLRARARIWIRFADESLYAHTASLLHTADAGERAQALERVYEDLRFMEQHAFHGPGKPGPYWMGDRFTLVDTTFFPWFEQRVALERYRGFAWPSECTRLLDWQTRVARRLAVQKQSQAQTYYLQQYAMRAGGNHA